ncbi:hypothetical protein YB2330_004305 [Saitoella coloradoensis]
MAKFALLTIALAFLSTLSAALPTQHVESQKRTMSKRDTPTGKRAIYYHTNWATYSRNYQVADLPIDYISDIAYAFYNLAQNDTAGGYTIKSGDEWADLQNPLIGKGVEPQNTWDSPDVELGNLGQFYKLKENGKDFDLSLSIGGWSWSTYFSDAVSTEASRKTLAASIVQLFESRPVFSGVSIDWEYLSDDNVNYGNTGNHVSTADPVNFMAFLTELRAQLAAASMSDYEISFCVTAAPEKIAFPVAEVVALVDQLHVMTYDFADGNWGDSISAHQANLFDSPYGKWSVDSAVKAYLNYGVPASKIYIGAPFYSRGFANTDGLGQSASGGSPDMSWETGVMDYKDLPVAGATEYFDEVAQAGYSYDPARRVFNTYETPRSLLSKCQYIHDMGLGGIIVWESSADAEYTSDRSLIKVLYENLTHGTPGISLPYSSSSSSAVSSAVASTSSAVVKASSTTMVTSTTKAAAASSVFSTTTATAQTTTTAASTTMRIVTPTLTTSSSSSSSTTTTKVATTSSSTTAATTTTVAASTGIAAWNGDYINYALGDLVSYNGNVYKCIYAHMSLSTWNPIDAVSLWSLVGSSAIVTATTATQAAGTTVGAATSAAAATGTASAGTAATATSVAGNAGSSVVEWNGSYVTYATGAKVTYLGTTYKCIQGHMSLPDWNPAAVAALWGVSS